MNTQFDEQENISANGLNSSNNYQLNRYTSVSFQFVWSDHSDTSTFELQSSLNGTDFDTVVGSPITTSGAAGSGTLFFQNCPFKYLRMTITEIDANVDSNIEFNIFAKNDK